jgi:glycerol-3-phosphate acyltransferase PlsY
MLIASIILLLIAAYLVGAIPSGYLVARWAGMHDIRRFGSGNIGATNVARFLGIKYFFIVFFLDAFKAYAYLVGAAMWGVSPMVLLWCAVALLCGNTWSLFLGGDGGKGMSTIIGILCAIHPMLFLCMIGIWLSALMYLRNVGIASVITMISLPVVAYSFTDLYGVVMVAFMGLWIIWRHRENIRLYYVVRL